VLAQRGEGLAAEAHEDALGRVQAVLAAERGDGKGRGQPCTVCPGVLTKLVRLVFEELDISRSALRLLGGQLRHTTMAASYRGCSAQHMMKLPQFCIY
jgi:hypothetical protein